jgi:hypothetical protein
LGQIHRMASSETQIVLSTPDRTAISRPPSLGPPANREHVREWKQEELAKYLNASGFRISRHGAFPGQSVVPEWPPTCQVVVMKKV